MPFPNRPVKQVRHSLDRNIHAITTIDASHGVPCRPEWPEHAETRCFNHIAYTKKSWAHAVQQLLAVRRIFEAAFDDEETYLEALGDTLDLFIWVFCICPMHHHDGDEHNTPEDWTKLCRTASEGFDSGLRSDDLYDTLMRSMNWGVE